MRYLTLTADYTASPLRVDAAGPVEPEDLGLDTKLIAVVRDWNERYRAVIPLGPSERERPDVATQIERLDREGLVIAERVAAALGDDSKVRYYSEGLLRHLL